jgi:HSP20 family protein
MVNRQSSLYPRGSAIHPSFAVTEDDREIAIRAELPGLSDQEVSVRCEDGVLYISGGKSGEIEEKVAGRLQSRESWAELFSRSLDLGNRMDWSRADASLRDGVLTVRLPKSAVAASPRIEIPIH